MPLKIHILSINGHQPAETMEASFDQDGGTIGRLEDKRSNHLCLPDPDHYISRIHAKITFKDNNYYLTDSSVHGTYVKNRDNRVHGDSIRLADGDCLWIGDYELRAHIYQPEFCVSAGDDIDRHLDDPTVLSGHMSGLEADNGWLSNANGKIFDNHAKQFTISNQANDASLHETFIPPDSADESDSPEGIPADFDFEDRIHEIDAPDDQPTATELYVEPGNPNGLADSLLKNGNNDWFSEVDGPSDDPALPQQIRQQAFYDLFHIFLEAAGVKHTLSSKADNIPQTMKTLGIVFKEMISGLRIFLKGLSEQKEQFRGSATQIIQTDNNPLIFDDHLDEALGQLVLGNKPGFMDASAAVREGFADMMNHQLAMTAGIQAAVIHLIERFDPQQFINQHKGSKFTSKKAKSWDAFRKTYAEITNTAMDDFFGEPFARAYEARLHQLQTQSEKTKKAKEE
jgi:type VI secretion system protein